MARSARACRCAEIVAEGLVVHEPQLSAEERDKRVVDVR
jgi:ABC-type microcin C transport system duplicated ATPase subunit YejF